MKTKRLFDLFFSLFGLLLGSGLLVLIYFLASIDTRSNGIFVQERIGQFGKKFEIFKFKTIHPATRRISFFGRFLRKSKLDEFPQLFNVLIGNMSFVGPRPDVEGYYDLLKGEEMKILNLKPGITSRASIKYKNEEYTLAAQKNQLEYNDTVIFPDKVKMNLEYYYNRSFKEDLKILIKTFF